MATMRSPCASSTLAKRRGLLTIGFAGHDGGAMATSPDLDHCFTIRSQSIHRIQESQAVVGYRLWSLVQELSGRRSQTATDDTQIIFGATIDDRLTGQVWVTVIATGLGGTGRAGPRTPSLVSALTASDDELEPPSFLRN